VKLSVYKHDQLIENVVLEPTEESSSYYVGRSRDSHVVLDDQQLSREHAVVICTNSKWIIKKTASLGSLIVNGTMLDEVSLSDGDIINIGSFRVIVSDIGTKEEIIEEPPKEEILENSSLEENLDRPEESDEQKIEDNNGDVDNSGADNKTEEIASDMDFSADSNSSGIEENSGEITSEDTSLEDDQFSNSSDDEVDDFNSDSDSESEFGFGEDSELQAGMDDSDDGGFDDEEGGKTKVIQAFVNFELEIFGELAPYDRYVIKDDEVYIGRDPEKCQIVLNDPEVSGVHSVIKKSNISCVLEDLKSSNGTLLNGVRINSSNISNNDEFIIGSTSFTVHVKSDLLEEESGNLMPVDLNQEKEVEEVIDAGMDFNDGEDVEGEVEGIDFGSEAAESAPKKSSLFSKDMLKDPQKRKKVLYIAVGLMMLWMFLGEDEVPKKKTKKNNKEKSRLLKNKQDSKDNASTKSKAKGKVKKLTPQEQEEVEAVYQLAKELYRTGKYKEAMFELNKIFAITPDYKEALSINQLAKQGLARLEELEKKRQKELMRKQRDAKVKELLSKAKKSVAEKKVSLSEELFSRIAELDPENYEVTSLKMELESWKKEQERIALEKAQKKAERDRQVRALKPGKTYYLKKEWHSAILKLEEFLRIKEMDEDLVKDASTMLAKAKDNLNSKINPMVGKAKSLREGQDLKGAYETYSRILKVDPTHEEALNEMNSIRETLELRAKRVYREGIIAESLSLFSNAKEKFQEVQQISPSDSSYYKKATEKLKEYLD
jgi:pSer/pThr/pTyr-binding forkhead associated (FHA) protein